MPTVDLVTISGSDMAFDMTGLNPAPDERGWAFVEAFARETEGAKNARQRSTELNANFVSPAEGAALRLLAATGRAEHVVEIGTSTGGATQWLLQGMPASGQITTIDVDGEHHRIAREIFAAAEIPQSCTRMITGRPLEVLPRLTDSAYDIFVMTHDGGDLEPLLQHAIRLLRLGGLIVVLNALGNGKVGDPAQRDPATVARRLFVQRLNNDVRLMTSLLPVGNGILAANVLSREEESLEA
jgi:predicted O-methyltransferase YrrM